MEDPALQFTFAKLVVVGGIAAVVIMVLWHFHAALDRIGRELRTLNHHAAELRKARRDP